MLSCYFSNFFFVKSPRGNIAWLNCSLDSACKNNFGLFELSFGVSNSKMVFVFCNFCIMSSCNHISTHFFASFKNTLNFISLLHKISGFGVRPFLNLLRIHQKLYLCTFNEVFFFTSIPIKAPTFLHLQTLYD